jgi:hypothetical protein
MGNLASRLVALPMMLAAALGAAGQAAPGQCGYERWPVKILADKDAARVDLKPVDTTVTKLVALPIHEIPYPEDRRIGPEELHVYRVRARLLAVYHEQDRDLHLVIADVEQPKVTMIAEIPAPECAASGGHEGDYQKARTLILSTPRNTVIELVGVGFFDFLHDQRGVAKNGIELHPVLSVRVLDSAPVQSPHMLSLLEF